MHKVICPSIAFGSGYKIAVPGHVVEMFLVAGHKMPLGGAGIMRSGILLQLGNAIRLRINGMRYKNDRRIAAQLLSELHHFFAHNRANGFAGGKEKVGHVGFSFRSFLRYLVSVLVGKPEIRHMVNHGFGNGFSVFIHGVNGLIAKGIQHTGRLRIFECLKGTEGQAGKDKQNDPDGEQRVGLWFFFQCVHMVTGSKAIPVNKINFFRGQRKYRGLKERAIFLVLFSCLTISRSLCQSFDGPVGSAGCLAIPQHDSRILGWASQVYNLRRGYLDIAHPENGFSSAGEPESVLGPAMENGVLSLGDGGSVTVGFPAPFEDGDGPDLAVFENAFSDGFLELALVAVSSDGFHFFTFPPVSETDTTKQVESFGELNPHYLHNLAGKYRAGYGTPFDLADLPDAPELNKKRITHVQITDVVGSLDDRFATRDSRGKKINDPYPTAYPTGGFDLDALGIFYPSGAQPITVTNPVNGQTLRIAGLGNTSSFVRITNYMGQTIREMIVNDQSEMPLPIAPGLYRIQIFIDGYETTQPLLVL